MIESGDGRTVGGKNPVSQKSIMFFIDFSGFGASDIEAATSKLQALVIESHVLFIDFVGLVFLTPQHTPRRGDHFCQIPTWHD